MDTLGRCALLFALFSLPSILSGQQRGVEIGLDAGIDYSVDSRLLSMSIPLQRVRAAFPSGDRLAFEPALSFSRLSARGESLTALVLQVGAVYDFADTHTTYTRPFVGFEYADASFSRGESVVDLGIGFGTRSRVADRLAVRSEGNVTGRFGAEGGTDGVFGVTAGLSFFTR
jgi:hypothetical protein